MTTKQHKPKSPSAIALAIVKESRREDGSYSSGGVGRFRSPVVAATVLESRMRLQAHVDAAGNDPEARRAALLGFFGSKPESAQ